MQVIAKCPGCGTHVMVKAGTGYTSEIVMADEKKCVGCGALLEIHVRIAVTKKKAEKAEAKA